MVKQNKSLLPYNVIGCEPRLRPSLAMRWPSAALLATIDGTAIGQESAIGLQLELSLENKSNGKNGQYLGLGVRRSRGNREGEVLSTGGVWLCCIAKRVDCLWTSASLAGMYLNLKPLMVRPSKTEKRE